MECADVSIVVRSDNGQVTLRVVDVLEDSACTHFSSSTFCDFAVRDPFRICHVVLSWMAVAAERYHHPVFFNLRLGTGCHCPSLEGGCFSLELAGRSFLRFSALSLGVDCNSLMGRNC